MKRFISIIFISFLVLLTVGCGKREYTEVTYNELMNKINDKQSFVVVIGSDTCSACASYKTTMEEVMKDTKVEIFYLDINELSEEDYAKLKSKFVINSTPTTIFLVDGKELTTYDRLVGSASYDTVINSLKKYGYVGE